MPLTRTRIPLLLTSFVLLASGCSTSTPEAAAPAEGPTEVATTAVESPAEEQVAQADPEDYHQGEIPEEDHAYDDSLLPDRPHSPMVEPLEGEPATDADRLAWEALSQVTRFAGHVDPDASYHCPDFAMEMGNEVACTVTFLGEEFTYSIEITLVLDHQYQYEDSLPEGPLLREVAEADMRHEYQTEYTICDMDEMVRTQGNKETDIRCSAIDPETGGEIEAKIKVLSSGSLSWQEV